MKVLYWTLANQDVNSMPNCIKADYMSDLLFHGLRSKFGANVIDLPKKSHLYKGYPNKEGLWGRGFTYTNILDEIDVDRAVDSIKLKKHYDLIVLSVHHTIHKDHNVLYKVLEKLKGYTKSKIVVVDGHDLTDTYDLALEYTPYLFKREIVDRDDLIPIHFAIPKEKVISKVMPKTNYIAGIIPADTNSPNRKTHSYEKEKDYYKGYQDSYFAFTCKKGGWDCLRHYEIMANGCIPIFTDIELCPRNTLTNLPKTILQDVKRLNFLKLPKDVFGKDDIDPNYKYINTNEFRSGLCNVIADLVLNYTRNRLTTEALADYFIGKIYENS